MHSWVILFYNNGKQTVNWRLNKILNNLVLQRTNLAEIHLFLNE